MENTLKKRVSWIDVAKGIGIVFVTLGHMSDLGLARTWIYSFHIPLFFFLAGCTFSNSRNPKEFVERKIKTLVLPYFSLGLVLLLLNIFNYFLKHELTGPLFIELLISFLVQRRMWTIWFLTCLFISEICFYFLTKFIKSKWILFTAVLAAYSLGIIYSMLVKIPLPWNIDAVPIAIMYIYLGYIFKMTNLLNKIENHSRTFKCILIVPTFMLNILFVYINWKLGFSMLEMFESDYGMPVLTFISSVFGVVTVILVSQLFDSNMLKRIGENSIIIFAWQSIFINFGLIVWERFNMPLGVGNSWCNFFVFVCVILLGVVVTEIITKTKLRVFIGR